MKNCNFYCVTCGAPDRGLAGEHAVCSICDSLVCFDCRTKWLWGWCANCTYNIQAYKPKNLLVRGFGTPGMDKIFSNVIKFQPNDIKKGLDMDVEVGQIWADKDKRRLGRQFRVDAIDDDKAICKVISGKKNKDKVQIRVDRFKPKYYSFVKDAKQREKPKPKIIAPKIEIKNDLLQRCNDFGWGVKWRQIQNDVVGLDKKNISFRLRMVDEKTYDMKMLIASKWILSTVISDTVEDALSHLYDVANDIRKDLHKILE